jgi:hypothetical protein
MRRLGHRGRGAVPVGRHVPHLDVDRGGLASNDTDRARRRISWPPHQGLILRKRTRRRNPHMTNAMKRLMKTLLSTLGHHANHGIRITGTQQFRIQCTWPPDRKSTIAVGCAHCHRPAATARLRSRCRTCSGTTPGRRAYQAGSRAVSDEGEHQP